MDEQANSSNPRGPRWKPALIFVAEVLLILVILGLLLAIWLPALIGTPKIR